MFQETEEKDDKKNEFVWYNDSRRVYSDQMISIVSVSWENRHVYCIKVFVQMNINSSCGLMDKAPPS